MLNNTWHLINFSRKQIKQKEAFYTHVYTLD